MLRVPLTALCLLALVACVPPGGRPGGADEGEGDVVVVDDGFFPDEADERAACRDADAALA